MRYFLIVGEASADLHASHLMRAIHKQDPQATFIFYGGDMMSGVGGVRLRHYNDMAYMGIIPVLLHLRQILRIMRQCQRDIIAYHPDVVILVDYPGFNLKMAKYIKRHTQIPVFYYISPKIWAWKEYRIKQIKQHVDEVFSILPFEVPFFEQKHHFPIHYVGNPTVEEVSNYRNGQLTQAAASSLPWLQGRPVIALLPGSRQQEIQANLGRMYQATQPLIAQGYDVVISRAPWLPLSLYQRALRTATDSLPPHVALHEGDAYMLLQQAEVALVTSGTATLETALFDVPQIVCYHLAMGALVKVLRRILLKVPYISLVNLVLDRPAVPELVASDMTADNIRHHLQTLVKGGSAREQMLQAYTEMRQLLGPVGTFDRAATIMVDLLRTHYTHETVCKPTL